MMLLSVCVSEWGRESVGRFMNEMFQLYKLAGTMRVSVHFFSFSSFLQRNIAGIQSTFYTL